MVDQLRFFAGAARVLEGKAAGEYMKGHTSWIRREPIGVVGQVTPVELPADDGRVEDRPGARRRQHRRAQAAATPRPRRPCCSPRSPPSSCPAGALNVITGDRETGRMLVEHPHPGARRHHRLGPRRHRRSPRAPRRNVKRVHLELGGKAPVIVFDDADIEAAVEGIADRRLLQRRPGLHRGHPRARRARHPRRLRRGARRVRPRARPRSACPTTRTPLFGPVNNARQLAHVSGFIDRLPDARHGRRPAATARRRPRRRLLPRADRALRAAARTTRPSRTRSSARSSPCSGSPTRPRRSRWANGVDYGLASWSGPRTSAGPCGCRAALDFGCVWINTHIPLVAEMPHGGFKKSGYGKDLSMYGFEDYTRIKHVMANIESADRPRTRPAHCDRRAPDPRRHPMTAPPSSLTRQEPRWPRQTCTDPPRACRLARPHRPSRA